MHDAAYLESDPGKHGRKKPPVPIDPAPPTAESAVLVDSSKGTGNDGKDGKKKRMTKAEKRQAKIRAAENRIQKREERKYSLTRRSKDGTWAKKGNHSYFGYKIHTVQGRDIQLIRQFVVTTASLHDSQVDLGIPGIPNYRDKGYFGSDTRGVDATKDKASRNHPLTVDQIRRNLRISRFRPRGETILCHEEDIPWRSRICDHGEKGQGQGNVYVPWL